MKNKSIIPKIVVLIAIIGFILGIIIMSTSEKVRDHFINTAKDIKKKPFMGTRK